MSPIEEAFKLPPEPNIERVGDGAHAHWLRFRGSEILALARFCYTQGDEQPVFVTTCERGDGVGSHTYEGFRIRGLVLSNDGAWLDFYYPNDPQRFQLQLSPDKTKDPSGSVISYIEMIPSCFPREEYMSFRDGLLRKQVEASH
jgi:hypothetical protein